jgi:hypothetical protein
MWGKLWTIPKIIDEPRDDMMFFPVFNGCSMFFLQKKRLVAHFAAIGTC